MEKREETTPRLDALRRSVAKAQAEKLKRTASEYRGLAPLKECDDPSCTDPDCEMGVLSLAREARDVPPGPAPLATITIRNATLTGRACALARELQDEVSLRGVTPLHLEDCVELPDDEPPLTKGVSPSTLDTLWGVLSVAGIVAVLLFLLVVAALIEGGRP